MVSENKTNVSDASPSSESTTVFVETPTQFTLVFTSFYLVHVKVNNKYSDCVTYLVWLKIFKLGSLLVVFLL